MGTAPKKYTDLLGDSAGTQKTSISYTRRGGASEIRGETGETATGGKRLTAQSAEGPEHLQLWDQQVFETLWRVGGYGGTSAVAKKGFTVVQLVETEETGAAVDYRLIDCVQQGSREKPAINKSALS